jgi:hypothetical protein
MSFGFVLVRVRGSEIKRGCFQSFGSATKIKKRPTAKPALDPALVGTKSFVVPPKQSGTEIYKEFKGIIVRYYSKQYSKTIFLSLRGAGVGVGADFSKK